MYALIIAFFKKIRFFIPNKMGRTDKEFAHGIAAHTMKTKLHLFSTLLGIGLFAFFYFVNPFGLEHQAAKVLSVAVLMLVWWLSEALPMPLVALLPLVLFPVLHISSIKEAAVSYGDPVIFLFMGGFMLGLAIEKWNLHKRIALTIVRYTGSSANRIILGFCISTGFLSMWLSNTATAMMMFPIAASAVSLMETQKMDTKASKNFGTAIMLCIAYSANIGGMATLIGTPPNVVFRGQIEKLYGYEVGFMEWMLLCLPLAVLLIAGTYFILTKLFPNGMAKSSETEAFFTEELEKLGPVSKPEKKVMLVFGLTALCWIFREQLNALFAAFELNIKLDDTIIALLGTFLLFILPANKKEGLLEWKDTPKIAWGVLLLFGGGLSLAAALEKVGIISLTGRLIAERAGDSTLLVMVLLTLAAIFLTEFMSNVALVTVFVPVVCGVAAEMHVSPLYYAIPVTLGASCAFMLPMGTPPNAIVFGTGRIKMAQMASAGFFLNIISGLLIALFSYFLIDLILPWTALN